MKRHRYTVTITATDGSYQADPVRVRIDVTKGWDQTKKEAKP